MEITRDSIESTMRSMLEEGPEVRPELFEVGGVNLTALAEAAAGELGMDEEGGPLDDPDHEIWEAAVDAAGRHMIVTGGVL